MGGTHCGKKNVKVTMAKMGGVGVIETVAKMGGAHRDKNGRNSPWQKRVELAL